MKLFSCRHVYLVCFQPEARTQVQAKIKAVYFVPSGRDLLLDSITESHCVTMVLPQCYQACTRLLSCTRCTLDYGLSCLKLLFSVTLNCCLLNSVIITQMSQKGYSCLSPEFKHAKRIYPKAAKACFFFFFCIFLTITHAQL